MERGLVGSEGQAVNEGPQDRAFSSLPPRAPFSEDRGTVLRGGLWERLESLAQGHLNRLWGHGGRAAAPGHPKVHE